MWLISANWRCARRSWLQRFLRRSRILPILAAIAQLVFLAGCRNGSGPTRGAEGAGRNVLNYVIGNDISNMDPALINDVESAIVATQVYQGLLKFKADSVDVEPDLAENYDVSPDGLTWTFRLRGHIRFHDGSPCDAEAVKFSVTRQMDANHPFHVPGKMRYARLLFGDPSSAEAALVTSVDTPDSCTVVFKLAHRYVPFAKNLAMTPAAVVSPAVVQTYGKDFNTTMSGTGPFRMKSYKPDQSVVLVRHENYWGARAPLDEVRFRILRDPNVRVSSIRKGESDVISGVEPAALPLLEADSQVAVLSQTSMNLGYLALNCERVPFDKKIVRQAISYAIDRDYIAQTLFSGTSIAARGIIPPGMAGYNPARKGFSYDPARAKALLAQAGYPNGFTVTLSTHDRPRVYNPVGAKLAEHVQQSLAKVGVTVKLDQMEFSAFLDRQKSREYQMSNVGWVSDNGDPDNFIFELTGREDNELNYSNPEATRLMREAAAQPDDKRRAELYTEAENLVLNDAPIIALNHAKQILAARRHVRNLRLHPTAVTQLHSVSLESK